MDTTKMIGELLDGYDYVLSGRPMYERITNTPSESKLYIDRHYVIRIETAAIGTINKALSSCFGKSAPAVFMNGWHGLTFTGKYGEVINLYYGKPVVDLIAWTKRKELPDYVEVVGGVNHLNPLYMMGKCMQLFDMHHGIMIYNYLRKSGKSHGDCLAAVELCGADGQHVLHVLADAKEQWSVKNHVELRS